MESNHEDHERTGRRPGELTIGAVASHLGTSRQTVRAHDSDLQPRTEVTRRGDIARFYDSGRVAQFAATWRKRAWHAGRAPGELTAPEAALRLRISTSRLRQLDEHLHPRIERTAHGLARRFYTVSVVDGYVAERARAAAAVANLKASR